jgi:hypothetical protein
VPSVVAVGIGHKEVENRKSEVRCVRIYVRQKEVRSKDAAQKISPHELPPLWLIPPEILGVPTDVILMPFRFKSLPGRAESAIRVEPPPGTWNLSPMLAGTLGAVVEQQNAGSYILGPNHVLAVNGRVPDGSEIKFPTGKPGAFVKFGVTGADKRKKLVPLEHGSQNHVDCALASFKPDQRATSFFKDLNSKKQKDDPTDPFTINNWDQVGKPELAEEVKKVGVATKETKGTIVDESADFFVDYSFGSFLFVDQIFIKGERFATDGDSGAILVAESNGRAIAMVFASAGNEFTAACPLITVLDQLEVKLAGKKPNQA